MLVSPRPAVFWVAGCTQAAYEAESAMPLHRPTDIVGARGLRSTLIRRTSRHDKKSRIVILFF